LTHCDAGQLQTELDAARKTLEDHLGSAITTMSLPGGRYNARVIAACLEAGYTRVFSSVPQAVSKMPGTMVGRLNIRGDMSVDWLSGLLAADSAVLAKLERQYKMKAAVQAVLGDRLYAKLWAVLNRQESETVAGGEAAE
jgi:peptidoglycan/xylan/chitin deacetylase (PgdA/CDA1 family)